MRKILLLGGSSQQIAAIETAKKLGYYTVLCDYLKDNPGQYHADKFYLVSTTDIEAVLEVAIAERIDGVLAYASDPAAPTAAYVAEQLGLPGTPYKSTEILCNKDKFREFLKTNGFCSPKAKGFERNSFNINEMREFKVPIIVKPVDSSGSKGATVVHDLNKINDAIEYALSFSRCGRFVIEEYIEKGYQYIIGGDIWVKDGEIQMWGLLNCHRDERVNPLVPVGKSFPIQLDPDSEAAVKDTLKRLVTELNIKDCGMNVELIVDRNGAVFPIDVGPRNGGNMIPDLLGYIFNVNVIEAAIRAAMGEKYSINPQRSDKFYATHNLHSDKDGIFDGVEFSPALSSHIIRSVIFKKCGDKVSFFDNAPKAIGIIFMEFDSAQEMSCLLDNINEYINLRLK